MTAAHEPPRPGRPAPPAVSGPPASTVAGGHVVISAPLDENTALIACTCGDRIPCDNRAAGWARQDHARTHAPRRRNGRP